MSTLELLNELSRQGVKVWADGDQLRCKAPKGVMTDELRSKLAEYKTELLTFLSRDQQTASVESLPHVVPDPAQLYEPFPTTDVQQAYWIGRSATFELGSVGNHGYIEVEAVDLDLARSLSILRQLIKRHPMLRAVMLPDGQQQILENVPPFCVECIDLSGLNQQEKDEQLAHIRQGMDHQVFQVEQWPALEIRVSRLQQQRIRIHASIESLFVDAWSIRTLIQEFVRLYHEPEACLPPLELSFRDYILAEAKLEHSEVYRRAQDYWTARIGDLPLAPDLPLAIDPAKMSRPHFIHREARMKVAQWQQLKAYGARAGLTPSGILLAAFAEVLATWSKSPRFCINLTLFNRLPLHEQVNELVGDFTSLLPLAVDHSTPGTFEQRARALQAQMWRDFDHRHYSGVRVLRDLARVHKTTTQAMLPVVFTSLLAQETANAYPMPWSKTIYCVTQTPQVWLDHQVLEEAGDLVLYWQAVDALFPAGLLDTMFAAYTGLLQRLATDEDFWLRKHLASALIPSAQLAQRASINTTETSIAEGLLQSFFLEQAAKHPNHQAVVSARRTLTYQDVLREATLLGYQLRQLGARPNHLVGVVMEKGWEQVVGVLGILLSGAAYLPIDPKLPAERLAFLLDHGKVEVVVTQSWIEKRVAWPERLPRLCVDELDMAGTDVLPLDVWQRSEDLAYVIYTSGSTGLPKGVVIDHRGAVNTIVDINQRFRVTSGDRVLALSALNFDLSVYDIFGVLAAGGTIVIPDENSLRNPAVWLDMVLQEQVTMWNTVPALLQMLVEYAEVHPEALSGTHLRLALLSGDWIPVSLPDRVRKLFAGIEIISLGGATEASIWSILYPIHTVDPSWKSIPYGKPMYNQRFFVLNELFEPCPVWVPGHLYIGGIGLAKGYWRDEQKTQASFFAHPLTGERIYRTGDLGRYLPDGNIEFLGREDFQVKVQGYRIELGEIEETLLKHPAVRAAIAVAITDAQGDKRLAAYVVLRSEKDVNINGRHTSYHIDGVNANGSTQDQQIKEQPAISERGNGAHPATDYDKKEQQNGALSHLASGFGQTSIRKDIDKLVEHAPVLDLTQSASKPDILRKYRERLSYRQFMAEPIPFKQFSDFLNLLSQIELEGLPKYLYPSAGGIYPVQTYVSIKAQRIEGIPGGIYYFNPQSSQLVKLADDELSASIHGTINQPIFDEAAFSLFLIADMTTISSLYGETARDFCLLEAGYMSQLLMMTAAQYHIGLCPIGGLDFEQIRDAFMLEESHLLLHTLLCGYVDPSVATGWSFLPKNTAKATQPATTNTEMTTELQRFLREKLPEYMVPSAILVLDSLPLTLNGKVDRKNLPHQRLNLQAAYTPPRNETEQQIVAIWQEMLNIAKIGIQTSFFEAGGDSLMSIKVTNRLEQVFGVKLSMDLLFIAPTIEGVAKVIMQKQMELMNEEQLAELLENVGQMSEEDAMRLLEKGFQVP